MAPWTREQLIARVQARIDESGGQSAVLSTLVIGQELDDAAQTVLLAAPPSILYPAGTRLTGPAGVLSRDEFTYSVQIPLPSNFFRFLRVRLHNWRRPLDTIVEANSPEYERQAHVFDRAVPNRPVAAVIPVQYNAGPGIALECFPAPDNIAIYETFRTHDKEDRGPIPIGTAGIANAELSGNKPALVQECLILTTMAAEAVPSKLVDPMVWLAASRCLTSLRVQEGSRQCGKHFEEAMSILGVKPNG